MNQHLDPRESALIIVDVQNDFCHEEGACASMGRDVSGAQAIVPAIEALIGEARRQDIPVVFIQMTQSEHTVSEAWAKRPRPSGHTDPLAICRKGSWGAEFYKLVPQPGDIIVEKHRYSAFIGTELDMILGNLNRKSLIITGVATNVCVESTARDGFMLDYHVTVVKDGSAGYSQELHESTFQNIEACFGLALHSSEVLEYWAAAAKLPA
ncbi:cysteine hydrolase family protein [Paenibacillus piri]|uniref:Cysteine hydrolase n=1 Tax=Paenibacillus piri TaxID=2547395 RepID=A0A4R5KD01_9BACL|nr:isochorismatase family cysteine hydrolase [Paenibacillus piri]TDF92515.1 cysteine hydrolase [Paenibacillus piri]